MASERVRSPETAMLGEIVQALRTEAGYEGVAGRIDEIEQRYASAAAGADGLPALRRAAARMGLAAAVVKRAPFDEVSARFRRACALGFIDPAAELAVLLEFAHACHALGRGDAGLKVLTRAEGCLVSRPGYNPAPAFVRQQSEVIRDCRQRLEGGAAEPYAAPDAGR